MGKCRQARRHRTHVAHPVAFRSGPCADTARQQRRDGFRNGVLITLVTLEFTSVLVAAATIPTSPVASTPAGRAPLKLSVAPTCGTRPSTFRGDDTRRATSCSNASISVRLPQVGTTYARKTGRHRQSSSIGATGEHGPRRADQRPTSFRLPSARLLRRDVPIWRAAGEAGSTNSLPSLLRVVLPDPLQRTDLFGGSRLTFRENTGLDMMGCQVKMWSQVCPCCPDGRRPVARARRRTRRRA